MTAWLALGDKALAWAGCDSCGGGRETELHVAERASGQVRTVARTSYHDGFIGWVGLEGDRLFWVDWAREQSSEDLGSDWRLRTCALPDCTATTLEQGAGKDSSPPYPTVSDGRMVVPLRPPWAVLAPGATDVHIYDTSTLKLIARQGINASAGEVHLAGSELVFESRSPYPTGRVTQLAQTTKTDVYALPLGANPAAVRKLSHGASDRFVTTSGTSVAWLHRDPPHGETGSIWLTTLDGKQQARKVSGVLSDAVRLAGTRLVYVTAGANTLRILDLETGKESTPPVGQREGAAWPAGVSIHRDDIAFSVRDEETLQETLYVVSLKDLDKAS